MWVKRRATNYLVIFRVSRKAAVNMPSTVWGHIWRLSWERICFEAYVVVGKAQFLSGSVGLRILEASGLGFCQESPNSLPCGSLKDGSFLHQILQGTRICQQGRSNSLMQTQESGISSFCLRANHKCHIHSRVWLSQVEIMESHLRGCRSQFPFTFCPISRNL